GPWNFTSLTCWLFSSPTILGCHDSVKRANFSDRLILSIPIASVWTAGEDELVKTLPAQEVVRCTIVGASPFYAVLLPPPPGAHPLPGQRSQAGTGVAAFVPWRSHLLLCNKDTPMHGCMVEPKMVEVIAAGELLLEKAKEVAHEIEERVTRTMDDQPP